MLSKLAALVLAVLLTLALPPAAPAQAPAGWTTQTVGTQTIYTPPDLKPGELYRVVVFPRMPMKGAVITDFLDNFSAREIAALGRPSADKDAATARTHNYATLVRSFASKQGEPRLLQNSAISVDRENVRIVSIVTSPDLTAFKRHTPEYIALLKTLITQEKADALEAGRGVSFEKTADAPNGMTPGGAMVPGIYTGNGVYSDDGKIGNRYRVSLYATGEYLICDDGGKEYEFGHGDCKYDPITGKLQMGITFTFNNNPTDPEDEFCLYGKDAASKPYMYARSNRGYGYLTVILHYAGPTDQPSPKQLEAQKAAADAEARRYKYVTAPGKGIQSAQIAGILHNQISNLGDGPDKNEVYLLLKDGTVHDGLPVPPDELDVSLSRRREPEHWGRWRRQGTVYQASWPDQPNHFEPLKGEITLPAKTGEQLAGRFGTGSTSGSTLLGGSWSLWGVKFAPGARFQKDSRGGSSSGTLGETMNDFSVNSTHDDDGSVTSFSTPSTVGYAKRKKMGGHRGGTYSLSGYTLTLHYDDGRTARLPFFFTSAKRDQIYFEGATLAFDDGK